MKNEASQPPYFIADNEVRPFDFLHGRVELGFNADTSYAMRMVITGDRFADDIEAALRAHHERLPPSLLNTLHVVRNAAGEGGHPPGTIIMYCTEIPKAWEGKEKGYMGELGIKLNRIATGAIYTRVSWSEFGERPVFTPSSSTTPDRR
jgi:hypothetical protein